MLLQEKKKPWLAIGCCASERRDSIDEEDGKGISRVVGMFASYLPSVTAVVSFELLQDITSSIITPDYNIISSRLIFFDVSSAFLFLLSCTRASS
jgi:hypothetical protein